MESLGGFINLDFLLIKALGLTFVARALESADSRWAPHIEWVRKKERERENHEKGASNTPPTPLGSVDWLVAHIIYTSIHYNHRRTNRDV